MNRSHLIGREDGPSSRSRYQNKVRQSQGDRGFFDILNCETTLNRTNTPVLRIHPYVRYPCISSILTRGVLLYSDK